MTFGERIQQLRKQRKMSQEELGEKLEVTRQTISKWELDQSTPDLDYIISISEFFEVTTDYLIKGGREEADTRRGQIPVMPVPQLQYCENSGRYDEVPYSVSSSGAVSMTSEPYIIKINLKAVLKYLLGLIAMFLGTMGALCGISFMGQPHYYWYGNTFGFMIMSFVLFIVSDLVFLGGLSVFANALLGYSRFIKKLGSKISRFVSNFVQTFKTVSGSGEAQKSTNAYTKAEENKEITKIYTKPEGTEAADTYAKPEGIAESANTYAKPEESSCAYIKTENIAAYDGASAPVVGKGFLRKASGTLLMLLSIIGIFISGSEISHFYDGFYRNPFVMMTAILFLVLSIVVFCSGARLFSDRRGRKAARDSQIAHTAEAGSLQFEAIKSELTAREQEKACKIKEKAELMAAMEIERYKTKAERIRPHNEAKAERLIAEGETRAAKILDKAEKKLHGEAGALQIGKNKEKGAHLR